MLSHKFPAEERLVITPAGDVECCLFAAVETGTVALAQGRP